MHIFQNGYIAGWGKTSESGFQSTELLEAVLPIVGTLECNSTYKVQLQILIIIQEICILGFD